MRHQGARQVSLAALSAHKGQHVCGRFVEALQPRHVNNAVAAGYERVNGAACLGSVAELAQGRDQVVGHVGAFVISATRHRQEQKPPGHATSTAAS